jgi:DNA-binding transcriptional LysR family regulator
MIGIVRNQRCDMQKCMAASDPDWSLYQSLLAVAQAGSLSAAARATGISQPTLGRHIRALEEQLGVTLFTRHAQGLVPTDAGLPLIEAAQGMAEQAARLARLAEGGQTTLAGTVRLTASRIVSQYLLPDVLARLRREAPQIQIELVPSDAIENLLFHQADIALRMARPEQLDIVGRHVADMPLGLYATPDFLSHHGPITRAQDLHPGLMVGLDRDTYLLRIMAELGFPARRTDFPLRCDDQTVHWELVRAGCGVGGMQCAIADPDPVVVRVLPDLTLPRLPMWLAAPETLRRNPRIRLVWDFLAEALGSAA